MTDEALTREALRLIAMGHRPLAVRLYQHQRAMGVEDADAAVLSVETWAADAGARARSKGFDLADDEAAFVELLP